MLSTRRHNSCEQFIQKLKLENGLVNPIKDIIATRAKSATHNYNFRKESNGTFRANTERFQNFVTVKY